MMDISASEYQHMAMRTKPESVKTLDTGLVCSALGLSGESGEFADLIKKHFYHEHELDRAKLLKELGDICWYVALAAETLGVSFGDILLMNITKLRERYPVGFDPKISQARYVEK